MNLLINYVKSIEVSRRHISGGYTVDIKDENENTFTLSLFGNVDAIEALPKAADFFDATTLPRLEAAE